MGVKKIAMVTQIAHIIFIKNEKKNHSEADRRGTIMTHTPFLHMFHL